jgi:phosphatidylglycerol:prolipoprotein diacylglycerol transferase
MLHYPNFDPIALSLGPLHVRWYGLMYLVGFLAAWILAHRRADRLGGVLDAQRIDDLLFYGILGVVLGGRLGYVFFYQTGDWLRDPWSLFRVWEGGMSFHGGLVGVLIAQGLFARRQGIAFFQITDFIAPLVPIGLGAGRIGNFINGELWGKPTDVPWGMQLSCLHFPEHCANLAPDVLWSLPLHPSQLYEAALEGLLLFSVLWLFSARPRPQCAVSGLFLVIYGLARFCVEFVRQPDPQLGYLAFGWLTMGQLLSLPMLLAGVALLIWAYRKTRAEI